ncbi:MAG: hypothetical protein R3350_02250 [Saprospiraceae bacterium]|nr:hypothetical protein [Saprospiraceae bacterium]
MQQSKLVKHIREMSSQERDRFSQFVYSPYFNQHRETRELLDVILTALDGSASQLDRRRVFDRLYPGEEYEEQKLHNVMSYLKKLYHRFLAQEYFEQQPYEQSLCAIEAAYDSNRFTVFTNRAKFMEKTLRKEPVRDSQFHDARYRLNRMLGYYRMSYVDRSRSTNMQVMLDELDRYYIAEKLKHSCHLTANTILMNTQYDFGFLDPLLDHIRRQWDDFQEDTSIVMYYTILMSLREEDNNQHYLALKDMLASKTSMLSLEEARDLYAFSYNYCILQINKGNNDYKRELFQLYRQGLKNELLLSNGILSEWNYKNITTLGCSLKEFEWTESFIQEYKGLLPEHRQENAFNYNLANLYYHKEMYDQAIDLLQRVQFTDVKYHLNSTFLLLRTYYELRDTEALLSLIETFRIYIIRNRKMTTDQKRGWTNFLRFAKKLVLYKHQASTYTRGELHEKLTDLSEKVEATTNIFNKHWLLAECRLETTADAAG